MEKEQRGQSGYGSSYRKGGKKDLRAGSEIGTVLGNQVWMVKPDKRAGVDNPCIWMQAGVVARKNCNNFYDCTDCRYDKGMKKKAEQKKSMSWQDAMRKKSGLDRVCRHSLTHRIRSRMCAYDYECGKCDFDQFFEDIWSMKTKSSVGDMQVIKGFEVPFGYHLHEGHTWARVESGGMIRVGLDDFAMKLLGQPDTLDLPLMGKELAEGDVGWGLKRKENIADVLSPIDGVIVEVNSKARENPTLAGREPYEDGWLFMVRTPNIRGSVKKLMVDGESIDWMDQEVSRLENMIEGVAGPLAADGGYLGDDIYGNLPDLGWENLTRNFLKT